MPYTNDSKPVASSVYLPGGSPIGLLLSLTYAMSLGYNNGTKPSSSYTNDTKPSNSYSNDSKP